MTSVMVTRKRHCMEGQMLEVLGKMVCRGQIQLLVVLGDGTKTLMPATWTDFGAETEIASDISDHATTATLGSLEDLVAIRALVDRLTQSQAARQSSCKEDNRATKPAQSDTRPGRPASKGADQPAARRTCSDSDNSSRRPDRQSSDGADGGGR